LIGRWDSFFCRRKAADVLDGVSEERLLITDSEGASKDKLILLQEQSFLAKQKEELLLQENPFKVTKLSKTPFKF
jgi:hypothetical protein